MGKMTRAEDDQPPLDRWRLDAVLEPSRLLWGPLWGLPAIAKVLGVSVDTARKWGRDPAVPIYQPCGSGQHFAYRSELLAWLRSKADQ